MIKLNNLPKSRYSDNNYINLSKDTDINVFFNGYSNGIRTITFDFVNSGFFQVVVTHNTRADKTYSFNGYIIDNPTSVIDSPVVTSGVFRVPVQAENTQHTVSFRSSSYLPASIVSADVEGFYYRRSQRV